MPVGPELELQFELEPFLTLPDSGSENPIHCACQARAPVGRARPAELAVGPAGLEIQPAGAAGPGKGPGRAASVSPGIPLAVH